MTTLHPGDQQVQMLLGEPRPQAGGTAMRPSLFAFTFTTRQGQWALCHGLTKLILQFDDAEADPWLSRFRSIESPVSVATGTAVEQRPLWHDAPARPSLLSADAVPPVVAYDPADPMAALLARHRFLVPDGTDEARLYHDTAAILRRLQAPPAGLTKYVVLPTTACNARCAYCYEAGMKPLSMSRQTALSVAGYICRMHAGAPVSISWFGGEPLLGTPAIDAITATLSQRGVAFTSGIITNGTLLTPALAAKARREWHLEQAQVTLDGTARRHDGIKACSGLQGRSAFALAIGAIRAFQSEGVRVNIRLNVSEHNAHDLLRLVDDLDALLPRRDGLTLYVSQLYADRRVAPSLTLTEAEYEHALGYIALMRRCSQWNAGHTAAAGTLQNHTLQFRHTYCMADELQRAVVISADGRLYGCEHVDEVPSFGTAAAGTADDALFARLASQRRVRPQCEQCLFLPRCTDFSGCPARLRNCKLTALLRTRNEIRWKDF